MPFLHCLRSLLSGLGHSGSRGGLHLPHEPLTDWRVGEGGAAQVTKLLGSVIQVTSQLDESRVGEFQIGRDSIQ